MSSESSAPRPRPSPIPMPSVAAREPVGGLPMPLSTLVGRERERAALTALLRDPAVRLVTLTGPGGVGKTRLALAAAAESEDAFADGAAFVELAAVRDPDLVVPAVAQALRVRAPGNQPVAAAVQAFLRAKELLLVLDNFEQVVTAGPGLAELLRACPKLTALVTSRALLRVSGEHAVPVPPLSLPRPSEGAGGSRFSPAESFFAASEAVRLFVERAREVRPDFALTEANAADVAEICRRLDGLPLAIELAAARGRLFPPAALLARLEPRLPQLTGGPRDLPARLQTMRDAIAWSHDLLTPEERVVFRRLGAFAGGASLDAADAVCAADGVPDPLAAVASLVDRSLVQAAEAPPGHPRVVILETVREYALEQLQASGEEAVVRARHAAWCLAFADRFGEGTASIHDELWWLREHDNVRAALAWLERTGDAAGLLRLTMASRLLWWGHGYRAEAIGWLERGLAMGQEVPARIRLAAMGSMGRHLERQGHYERARSLFEEALALAQEVGEQRDTALALYGLGTTEANQGRYDRATPLMTEALALFRRLGDDEWVGGTQYLLGIIAYGRGDFAEAAAQVEDAVTVRRRIGPIFPLAVYLNALGLLQCELGDAASGAAALAESGTIIRTGPDTHRDLLAEWLAAVARLAASCGRLELAARLYGAAEALTEAVALPLVVPPRPQYRRAVEALRRELGADASAAAWAAGRTLPLDQAVAEAEEAVVAAADRVRAGSFGAPAIPLSPRELEVLALLAAGRTHRAIGEALFIGERTVDRHVDRLYRKLERPHPRRGDRRRPGRRAARSRLARPTRTLAAVAASPTDRRRPPSAGTAWRGRPARYPTRPADELGTAPARDWVPGRLAPPPRTA